MKMCLAPCFAGCTKEEYDVEVQRLVQFLETGGSSLRNVYEAEREKASEELDFERASVLHKKLEKVDEALRGQPELPRRIQDLNAVIFQRAGAEQTIAAFPVFGGRIAEPFYLSFSQFAGEPRSAEQFLRGRLESSDSSNRVIPHPPERTGNLLFPEETEFVSGDLSENLWLLARWFYSNPREGEIFFREKVWPYRKMMRACARLLAPPEQQPGESNAHPENTKGENSPS
jgi:hypothetical protein